MCRNGSRIAIIPVTTPSTTTLSSSDITLVGAIRQPASGVDLSGAYGSIGGRKVGGNTHLLVLGNANTYTDGPNLYEFDITGLTPSMPYTSAPQASLVTNWGDFQHGLRESWTDNTCGTPMGTDYLSALNNSVYWNSTLNMGFTTFVNTYTDQAPWSVVGFTLDNPSGPTSTAYGPWRFIATDQQSTARAGTRAHFIYSYSQNPDTDMLMGGISKSGNVSIPWGPSLFGNPSFPTTTTTGGCPSTALTQPNEYINYYEPFSASRISSTGTIQNPPLQTFQWTNAVSSLTYVTEAAINPVQIDPVVNSGLRSWGDETNTMSGGMQFHGAHKQGYLFWGTMSVCAGSTTTDCTTTTHEWYRNAGLGNDKCTHGCSSPTPVTGPTTTCAKPVLIIYPEATLNGVKANTLTDYAQTAATIIDLESTYGIVTGAIDQSGAIKAIGGGYFDPSTNNLYLNANRADTTTVGPGFPETIFYVFHINDSIPFPLPIPMQPLDLAASLWPRRPPVRGRR